MSSAIWTRLGCGRRNDPGGPLRNQAAGRRRSLFILGRAYLDAIAGMARAREVIGCHRPRPGDSPIVIYLPRRLTVGELRFRNALAWPWPGPGRARRAPRGCGAYRGQ